MKEIVNKILLAGDKFIPQLRLRQPGFIYSACGPFTKNKGRTQKFKETWDSRYIYQNELDNVCFRHDIAYWEFKDLTKRIASDKTLRDKGFNIAKNLKYDVYQRGIALMVYRFFDKNLFGSGIKNKHMSDQQLAEELNKRIIKKFNKRKVQSPFIDNVWGVDLTYMHLISKFNKGIVFYYV